MNRTCTKDSPASAPSQVLTGGGRYTGRAGLAWNFEYEHPDAVRTPHMVEDIEYGAHFRCPHCGQSYYIER